MIRVPLPDDKTHAWPDLGTTKLPNGLIDLRISAFNVAPGQPRAREIIAMPTRQWIIRN